MKRIATLFAIAISIASTSIAQETITVYIRPSINAPQIGNLEAISLAVNAQWPENVKAVEGWQPVYFRGKWEVYVDNNDIAKDLSVKPGSLYYLAPDKNSTRLSIATDKDQTDILGVDTPFCKLQLETILTGYIPSSSIDAQKIVNSLPTANTTPKATTQEEALPITELRGIVAVTGLVAKSRSGLDYKLEGTDGKALALLDPSKLPERIRLRGYVGKNVRITGTLKENENGSTIILLVQNLSILN